MKANWKLAIMFAAVLAFVACDKKAPGGGDDPEDPQQEYVKPISVKDASLADWDKLPAEYVFSETNPEGATLFGLKSVKVYADKMYIFILVETDPEEIGEDLSWIPFHAYINTDNSDETGGYSDEFTDANADILLEGAIYATDPIAWGPAVFHWWGEVGGNEWKWHNPDEEQTADNKWGADVGEGELTGTTSQYVDGKFEIEILRELVPTPAGWSEDEFGIGFDIQDVDWHTAGILPAVDATDENPTGIAHKMQIKINK